MGSSEIQENWNSERHSYSQSPYTVYYDSYAINFVILMG